MEALAFWKVVTMDESGFLERLLALLRDQAIRYCVVGGQAVNAYVEPLVSLDLDLALAAGEVERLEPALSSVFGVERFPHSLNVSSPGSDLRVQVQLDPRYEEFPGRAEEREVLGLVVPVARLEDVLQGKVWAALDPRRRPSKRQKDLADIARLVEAYPPLRERVPADLLARLL
jgi:Nucleotidyl transferase AbiEii toxin, Type IV TA system